MIKEFIKRNRNELKFTGIIFFIWRILIIFISYIAIHIFEYSIDGSFLTKKYDNTLYQYFLRFDSGWYLDIARNGYSIIENSQSNVAFFPLFPLLMKIGNYIPILGLETSGILLANIFAFLSFFVFYKLLLLKWKDISKSAFILFIIFPSSFFLGFVYSESLFLFLTLSAWYFAEKGKILQSSVFGFLAASTRSLGFFIFIPIVYKYLKEKKFNKQNILTIILIPLGIVPFLLFLNFKFNDFLFFQKIQKYWGREFDWVWNTIYRYIKEIVFNINFFAVFDLLTLMIVFCLVVYLWMKVDKSYSIWVAIGILIPALTGTFASINRYSLVLFPIFIALAKILKNKILIILYYISSISTLIYLTARFTLRYWGG